jgi:hypothetical protein
LEVGSVKPAKVVRPLPVEESLTLDEVRQALGYKSRRSVYNVKWLWEQGRVHYVNGCPRWLRSTITLYRTVHQKKAA